MNNSETIGKYRLWTVGDEWIISLVDGSWLQGTFESKEAALCASEVLPEDVIFNLQESVNPGGVITRDMVLDAVYAYQELSTDSDSKVNNDQNGNDVDED